MGWLIDRIANFLLPNDANYVRVFLLIVAVPSFTGELWLASWLLVKAVKFNSQRQEKLLEDQKLSAGDLTDKHSLVLLNDSVVDVPNSGALTISGQTCIQA
ncbi:MAG: hypothetical protein ACR2OU_10380 [Thermomicrobiales bacterium]